MPTARNHPDSAATAVGDTPDVVVLDWAGKAVPAALVSHYGEILHAVRGVRAAVRDNRAETLLALPDQMADAAAKAMMASLIQAAQRELANANRHDAVLFASWSDFYNHTRFAMAPAGRLLLQRAGLPPSEAMDALMTALALVAALQEAPQRYRASGIVSLPLQWLSNEGVDASALAQSRCTPSLRRAYARGIDRAQELLAIAGAARSLQTIGPWAGTIVFLLRRLLRRLQRRDFLARPVALGLFDRVALRLRRHD